MSIPTPGTWLDLRAMRAVRLSSVAPVIDREELKPHFGWLSGSEYYDEALGDAVLAIELTALGYGNELMRYGLSWMLADGVVEVFELEEFVKAVRDRRAAAERWPESFGRAPSVSTE